MTNHEIIAGRAHVTDSAMDHVEIWYPDDRRRHWIVHPGGVLG